jgi:hypothetical protein
MEHYYQKFKLEPLGRTILILPPKKRPSGGAENHRLAVADAYCEGEFDAAEGKLSGG